MNLPPDISFLNSYLVHPKDAFRKARWLLSDFDESVWLYSLDFKKPKKINWAVKLSDGILLTSAANKSLLDGLKYFLIVSTRNQADYSSETNAMQGQQRKRFAIAGQLIDLLLLNSDRYQLAKYGLGGLTLGNLKEILETVASDTVVSESIYNWSTKLRSFCLDLLNRTDPQLVDSILASNPAIATNSYGDDEDDENGKGLGVSPIIAPRIRAALYANKLYIRNQNHGWAPDSIAISKIVYSECLWGGAQAKPTFSILCYRDEYSPFDREYDGVRVTTGQRGRLPPHMYTDFRTTLYNLGVLHEIGLPAPAIEDLIAAEKYEVELASQGKHRTLPSPMIFKCLRQAIEFHLSIGTEIVNGFCRLVLHCRKHSISAANLQEEELVKIIGEKLYNLGVREYGLSAHVVAGKRRLNKGEKARYYNWLRNNRGLTELLRIYIGSVQFAVGIMMARRVTELCNIMADTCLDDTEQWLIFSNAKSTRNLFGIRRRIARPIEPITVDMIKNLIRMQKTLVRIGYLNKTMTLFASPHLKGLPEFVESDKTTYNRNLNFFCDYFETPINDLNQRYYVRQHQLRRFFAMLFFYCGSFGTLDTLQWMLGHNDPSHVWHYITESTDGVVLQGAKAHYVAEMIHQGGAEDFHDLSELLKSRYGSSDFCLIDTNDLEDRIQELMSEGTVEIEPEFFTDETGKHFHVVAKLKVLRT